MMGKERVETNSGLSKDLYQVKETWKVSFILLHSIMCALAYFDPPKIDFNAKIDLFSHFCATQRFCSKRYNVKKLYFCVFTP